MSLDDPVLLHLDLIARMLEAAGYALEVDYSSLAIIVWVDNWPIHLSVKKAGRTGSQPVLPNVGETG